MQMLCFNVFWILILTVWGLIGIHTDKFGFKHVWEIWYYILFHTVRDVMLMLPCVAQVVPGVLWPDGLSLVCVQSDHDQRSFPSATDVRVHPTVQSS